MVFLEYVLCFTDFLPIIMPQQTKLFYIVLSCFRLFVELWQYTAERQNLYNMVEH